MGNSDAYQVTVPKKLLSKYIPDGLCTAVVESWQRNGECYSGLFDRSQYLIDLSQCGSNHFLSEDMFTCLSSSDHHMMMEICRCSNNDAVNIGLRQNIVEFLVKGNAQCLSLCSATFRRFIPYGYNFCRRMRLGLFDIVLCMNMPETEYRNTNHGSSPLRLHLEISILLSYRIYVMRLSYQILFLCLSLYK